ncbi:cell surface protein fimA fimbrial subunit [Bifidobacterium adolescentis]|uniref:Putative fimbrial subunit FimA n=2 Tax=Bifidobacterium ruminantium TaxID=78346 RepID=A0A087CVP2_BIFRU|nr:isopeptide-forming domain-containing fimbrial protein [Bifidobacterium adolescentis]KFI87342.1 putative fimbrial subunit FimA [Bifidobacterium ruminantium]OSH02063.1 cell surface protein fimA fimbrial subunit [Bifidobacterium adolescentis]
MKMRKLFAGIAATATLLGGMALGAASAQADGPQATTPLLQVNNAQEGHTYTPYKFATFANADNGSVEVNTVDAWKTAVTTAADAADNDTKNSVPAEYANNPAAYVATFNAEQIRKFATELAKTNPLPTVDGAGLTVTADKAGTTQPVTVNGEGWYLVTDTYTKTGDTEATTGTPAIVATTVNGLTNLTIAADKVTGQGNIKSVGQFNAKNENPLTPPVKTAKVGAVDVNGKTVNVGDTVNFTVSATVPASAANYDSYPFTITDTASKGLQVANKTAFKVQVDGKNVDSTLYTVTQTGAATEKDGTTTTIKFANAKTLAGQTIVVSYTGTVTKDALTGLGGSVNNKATVTTNGGTSEAGETNAKTYGFQFKKIGVGDDTNALADAQFVVKKGDKYLKQDNDGAWSLVDTQEAATTFTSANKTGLVQIKGLAAGDYTVMETAAPNGYAQNFKVTFDVNIAEKDGTVTFTQDALHQVTPPTGGQIATVKNVKSITQLPLTGAAGTTLFTVVALLVAGAGVTVAVKSRQRTH